MSKTHNIAVLPGDGIGPEVISAAVSVLETVAAKFNFQLQLQHYPLGANDYLATGKLFADYAEQIANHDAILFGAMGDPRVTPGILERGIILAMRKQFTQAANVRPVRVYPNVQTPIKGLTPADCDIVFVRENTEGAYVAEGLTVHENTPLEVAVQESVNTRAAIERVVIYAFKLAMQRRKQLTLCHKTNVLVAAGKLWQRVVNEQALNFPQVQVDYVHVDAMCFHLPLNPARFDVVVTDNLFGDIVTDLGAVIQGGLGVATSANLNLDGKFPSMFEAIHGSAPDIAGQNIANPAGAILAAGLMLGHLGEAAAASAIEAATVQVLGELAAATDSVHSTQAIGKRVCQLVNAGTATPVAAPLAHSLAAVNA